LSQEPYSRGAGGAVLAGCGLLCWRGRLTRRGCRRVEGFRLCRGSGLLGQRTLHRRLLHGSPLNRLGHLRTIDPQQFGAILGSAALLETGRNHGDAEFVAHALVDLGTEDDIHIRVCAFADHGSRFVDFKQAQVRAASDVEQNAA